MLCYAVDASSYEEKAKALHVVDNKGDRGGSFFAMKLTRTVRARSPNLREIPEFEKSGVIRKTGFSSSDR